MIIPRRKNMTRKQSFFIATRLVRTFEKRNQLFIGGDKLTSYKNINLINCLLETPSLAVFPSAV